MIRKTDQKITKAVIAVAGSGTRLLPATKAQPKEMLPIVDTPIIQYIVEELIEAGVKDVILVTKWDKKTLEDHFDRSFELEYNLEQNGKNDALKKIKRISELANFIYVRQKGPYGNGTPLLSVASLIGDEPFFFAFGDDLVKSKISFAKQLLETYKIHQSPVIGVQKVPRSSVDRYGIVKLRGNSQEIAGIVEKPSIDKAPSELAQFGRMILNREIIDILKDTPLGKGNELWLADAIETYVKKGNKAVICEVKNGEWFTTGDPLNYFKAFVAYALSRKDIGKECQSYLKEIIS